MLREADALAEGFTLSFEAFVGVFQFFAQRRVLLSGGVQIAFGDGQMILQAIAPAKRTEGQ